MHIKKHYALTGEDAFEVRVQKQMTDDGDRYRVFIQSAPSMDNGGIPTETIEMVLSERQYSKLHEATDPWPAPGRDRG
jgi:hypothetical protein